MACMHTWSVPLTMLLRMHVPCIVPCMLQDMQIVGKDATSRQKKRQRNFTVSVRVPKLDMKRSPTPFNIENETLLTMMTKGSSDKASLTQRFHFDSIHSPSTSTPSHVYTRTVRTLVSSSLRGYDASLVCFPTHRSKSFELVEGVANADEDASNASSVTAPQSLFQYSQSHINYSIAPPLPLFSKCIWRQNLDLRCVLLSDPSTFGALLVGVGSPTVPTKIRLESRFCHTSREV